MFTFNAENRDTGLKPKQLRKKGIIPGVLYGKDLEKSLSIQFSVAEATRIIKSHSTGSKVELVIGKKKFSVLLREATFISVTNELEHLSFQTLLAGEIVTSTARIVIVNRDKVSGMVQQSLSDISYRTLPSHLIDKIEIDLEGMKVGTSIRISDLEIAQNPDIEILSPLDTMVLSIIDTRMPVETIETDDESSETENE